MHALLKKFAHIVFPHRCLLCELNGEKLICNNCFETLPQFKSSCKQCGLMSDSGNDKTICGQCIANSPPFENTFSLFEYAAPISSLIWQLKFHGNLSIAQLFAHYWIDFIPQFYAANSLPDLIVPVPLHHARLKERGFNQALEITKPIGKYFHIPVDTRSCIRIKHTQPQSSLIASKRKNNLKNAFGLSYPVTVKHIAILDDVMTTGNTVTEVAHLFKKVGVEKIDIWCCARTR